MTAAAQHPSQTERDAARQYLEHSHSAAHLQGKPAHQAERHAQEIDEQHSRARDIALTGTARELGKLPSHLARHQRDERHRAGISTEQANHIRREYRRTPNPDSQPEPHSPRARAENIRVNVTQAAGRAGSAISSGASAAADTSFGEDIMEFFLWGMVLSIGYLALTRANSIAKLFDGLTTITRAVISPAVDPLNHKGALL